MADQGEERQLVVFDLAGEVYGVNIETVREIIRMQTVMYVPDAPEFVEGVINLRGRVIPVVDLRKRFALNVSEATEESRVVVVDNGRGIPPGIRDRIFDPFSRPRWLLRPPDWGSQPRMASHRTWWPHQRAIDRGWGGDRDLAAGLRRGRAAFG